MASADIDIAGLLVNKVIKARTKAESRIKNSWHIIDLSRATLTANMGKEEGTVFFKNVQSNIAKLKGRGTKFTDADLLNPEKTNGLTIGKKEYLYNDSGSNMYIITRSERSMVSKWNELKKATSTSGGKVHRGQFQSNTTAGGITSLGSKLDAYEKAFPQFNMQIRKARKELVKYHSKFGVRTNKVVNVANGIASLGISIVTNIPQNALTNSMLLSLERETLDKLVKSTNIPRITSNLTDNIDEAITNIFLGKGKTNVAFKSGSKATGLLVHKGYKTTYKGDNKALVNPEDGQKAYKLSTILRKLNERISKSMQSVMGESTDSALFGPLRMQTGRFANSVKIESLSISETAKTLYIGFDYARNPYGVFASDRSLRRPKKLVGMAVREILRRDAKLSSAFINKSNVRIRMIGN